MTKLSKKTIIILIVVVVLLLVGVPSTVYGYNSYSYKKSYNEAVKLINEDKFDEATAKLYTALDHKKSNEKAVKQKLETINKLRVSKQYFEDASKLMGDKKYIEAAELYKKISKEDEKRYADAQKKIEECKTTYISIGLTSAKDLAKDSKFEEALKAVEGVLSFDKENAEAATLKKEYEETIQKLKAEAEAKAKAAAEELARKEAEAKAKAEAAKAITAKATDGNLEISDNGEIITFTFNESTRNMFNQLSYSVIGTSNRSIYIQANYRIIFYDNSGHGITATGVTSDFIGGRGTKLDFVCYPGTKYDVYVTYKGKEYKFSGVTRL